LQIIFEHGSTRAIATTIEQMDWLKEYNESHYVTRPPSAKE